MLQLSHYEYLAGAMQQWNWVALKQYHTLYKPLSFKEIRHRFSNWQQLLTSLRLKLNLLLEKNLTDHVNAYEQVQKLYTQLVQQLKYLGTLKQIPDTKKKKLIQTIGCLTPSAADMHQPLHTTKYTNWRMPFLDKQGEDRFTFTWK